MIVWTLPLEWFPLSLWPTLGVVIQDLCLWWEFNFNHFPCSHVNLLHRSPLSCLWLILLVAGLILSYSITEETLPPPSTCHLYPVGHTEGTCSSALWLHRPVLSPRLFSPSSILLVSVAVWSLCHRSLTLLWRRFYTFLCVLFFFFSGGGLVWIT